MTTSNPQRYQRKSPEQLDAEREQRHRQLAAHWAAETQGDMERWERQCAEQARREAALRPQPPQAVPVFSVSPHYAQMDPWSQELDALARA